MLLADALFMLISVKTGLFWLQVDQRKVEVLRRNGVQPLKICLGLVVIEIVDLYNWPTIFMFGYFSLWLVILS